MRALRILHGDLPDLHAARRRARQSAGADLPDQGHARERAGADRGRRQAHRQVPELPLVHDDVSVRRELHASRRPRAPPHRDDLPEACDRPRDAPRPRGRAASTAAVSRDPSGVAAGGAARRALAEAARRRAEPRSAEPAEGLAGRPAANLRQRRKEDAAGRAAQRLRPAGSCAGDQRGDDPAPHASRLRGGRRAGGGLLRRAHPSSRAGRARFRPSQHLGLVARDRARRAGRDRRQRLRLRHDGQGLRLRVPQRSGARRAGRQGLGARPRRDGARGRNRPARDPHRGGRARRLPQRLLAAARSGRSRAAEGAAPRRRFRRARAARGAPVLRLGRGLQPPAAGHRGASARPEDREHSERLAGRRRGRQHRLSHADRGRDGAAGRPHGRASRLGDRRAETGGGPA